MKYNYYPGCSLEGTATEYDIATRAFIKAAGCELVDIDDWTCCGASAADAVSHLLSLALPARVIALAEQQNDIDDILVPCSACYLNLKRVTTRIPSDLTLARKLNLILEQEGLALAGRARPRHLLDVITRDIGPSGVRDLVTTSLEGLTIAPYYGCQCLRPYAVFDDPEAPVSMEPFIEAVGGRVHPWDMGGKCCGASHMNTKPHVAMELVGAILKGAQTADAIVTVCPMCQMNLEAHQKKISRLHNEELNISILYLPQLLGLALGLSEQEVGMNLNLSVTREFRNRAGLTMEKREAIGNNP